MSQRESGYERKERDLYETPAWVTEALLPHLRRPLGCVWECASGSGKMVRPLQAAGLHVTYSDISEGEDFLRIPRPQGGADAIVTNPPYELATEFIKHALFLMQISSGVTAMLLRTDFDHAKTRSFLFAGCPAFAKKVVLTKRIKWFEDSKGQPSFNHAWFIWDWKHDGPPTLAYGPVSNGE
jgi:hypothetical protein